MRGNLTIDSLRAAVDVLESMRPPLPPFEIWSLRFFPRFGDDGEPMVMKILSSELPTIWQSVTGTNTILMMHPLTLTDISIETIHDRNWCGEASPLDDIPVFGDEQLREHWVKSLNLKPAHFLFYPINRR